MWLFSDSFILSTNISANPELRHEIIFPADVLTAARALSRLQHIYAETSPDKHTRVYTCSPEHVAYTYHKPVAVCRLSVHWSRIAYYFHSHKYYDYEYCVVVNRSLYHQLCALGPRDRVIGTLGGA